MIGAARKEAGATEWTGVTVCPPMNNLAVCVSPIDFQEK
jgi:hypothetical protein